MSSTSLSEFFIEIAKKTLNEDENRKQQALERLNEWITKHPFIRIYEKANKFHLAFLRAKKYNFEQVFKSIEKTLIFFQRHPESFDFIDNENFARILQIFDDGFIVPSTRRDSEGRKMVYLCVKRLNTEKFTPDDMMRAFVAFFDLILLEEETQLGGVFCIVNLVGISLSVVEKYLIHICIKLTHLIKHSPLRIKQMIVVGLPPYAAMLMNLIKGSLTEKINRRTHFLECFKDVWEIGDKAMLEEVTSDDFSKTVEVLRNQFFNNFGEIKKAFSFDIDLEKLKVVERENYDAHIGNFRMLEVD